MPQDVNIFGNCVAPRCFKSQILKASRNPVLRGQWQLSRKPSSKGKLLTALPLRSLFFPACGERRRQTKDSYAKGRLKPNAYFDSFFFFFFPYGQNSRILPRNSVAPEGQLQDISWGVYRVWVLRLNISAQRYNSCIPSSYNLRCKTAAYLFSRSPSKIVDE